jgi:membrane associated rhomboid family serine protease
MLPIRDTNPRTGTPFVNIALIVANILMFFWELSLGPNLERVMHDVAFVPARFWMAGGLVHDVMTMFVSMFLHGGWLHLGSNMLYLWIFGDNIEDRMGHFRYLIFYLLCGIGATLAHAFTNGSSAVPAIGASGAIAGVLGGYLLLFPHARVMTFIPIGFFVTLRELPALLVLGLWFVIQIFTGAVTFGAQEGGGVAYFAHIGGFVAGMALVHLFAKKEREKALPHYSGPQWRL